jgi:DNA-binding CsgD family transcriptional regulator
VLLGRRSERELLDGLLQAVRGGESRVLVLRGEPGVGKSALLDWVAERASGCRVGRAAGVQSEVELAYAGLHQLCASMLDHVGRLPLLQRDALETAFGLRSGARPDRFLVALAALGLLSEVAEEQPLVCLVDDAQWLDLESLRALEFVAHRLFAESVALVFAARPSANEQLLAGLPELLVEGLVHDDARALLDSVMPGGLDELVRDRIVVETRGNPLALLELPHGLAPDLAGGFGVPSAEAIPRAIEESFKRRLEPLPAETQRLLLLAAADPLGDAALVWRAAEILGIGRSAADAPGSDRLAEFGDRVTFRHPLVRSVIYTSRTPQQRREVHQALARATDGRLDPDRRAWHLAQAAPGPDEEVASELERCASRARARGGLSAVAAFLERSTELTLDPTHRAARALAAAAAKAHAGGFEAALRLLATAEAGPLEDLDQGRADRLRGQIAFASRRGSDASPLLLKAAKRAEALDVGLARETYLEALSAAQYAAGFVKDGSLREAAEAARSAPAPSQPPHASDLLLDALALLITEGQAAAAGALRRTVSAFSSEGISGQEGERWLSLVWPSAQILWDDEAWHGFTTRWVQRARDEGALGVLPIALRQRAGVQLYEGHFDAAASLCDEAVAIAEATGGALPLYIPLALAAFRGRSDEAAELAETNIRDVMRRGEIVGRTFVPWARAVLYNGLARYQEALAAAQEACEDPDERVFSLLATSELIEAAARSGVPEQAAGAVERLSQGAHASGTNWALGIDACARALLSDGDSAEGLYREALDRLGRTRIRMDLARAHLLYGEWLRRQRRRMHAREQLRAGHELFVTMGAEGFAERSARELLATGETARKRATDTRSQLTPQETQVAQLARAGLSNPEIATRLFISTSTVQHHLRNVFSKLDIDSRMQLHKVLGGESDVADAHE